MNKLFYFLIFFFKGIIFEFWEIDGGEKPVTASVPMPGVNGLEEIPVIVKLRILPANIVGHLLTGEPSLDEIISKGDDELFNDLKKSDYDSEIWKSPVLNLKSVKEYNNI